MTRLASLTVSRTPGRRAVSALAAAVLASLCISAANSFAEGKGSADDDDVEWLDATPTPDSTPLVITPGKVVDLNAYTFDSLVATGAPVLVEL